MTIGFVRNLNVNWITILLRLVGAGLGAEESRRDRRTLCGMRVVNIP